VLARLLAVALVERLRPLAAVVVADRAAECVGHGRMVAASVKKES
jgi:hypothetical protein